MKNTIATTSSRETLLVNNRIIHLRRKARSRKKFMSAVWTALIRCSRRVPGWQVQQTFPACMWDCSGVTAHLVVFHAAHRTASSLCRKSGALISGSCCCRCSFTVIPLDAGKDRISQERQEINYILILVIKIYYILCSSQFNYIKDDLC